MKLTVKDLNKVGSANREMAVKQFRKGLMAILDIYDKNVLRKRIDETDEQRLQADEWLLKLRDKDESALTNIPENVVKHYKKDIENIIGVNYE